MPDDLELTTLDNRMVCTGCGAIGDVGTQPNWSERSPPESNSVSTWGMVPRIK